MFLHALDAFFPPEPQDFIQGGRGGGCVHTINKASFPFFSRVAFSPPLTFFLVWFNKRFRQRLCVPPGFFTPPPVFSLFSVKDFPSALLARALP